MHLSTVNFIMIMIMFIQATPFSFWLVMPLAGIGVFVLGYLDYRFILPREMQVYTVVNPFMVKIKDDLAEIKEMLVKK
jgi:hypothetical protein